MKSEKYIFNKKEIGLVILVGVIQLGLTGYLMRRNYKDGFDDAIYLSTGKK